MVPVFGHVSVNGVMLLNSFDRIKFDGLIGKHQYFPVTSYGETESPTG